MRPFPVFKGPLGGIILSLSILALAITVTVKSCSTPMEDTGYDFVPGSGDTINVAIDYSPMSLYRYGDSLAGFNYDMMREMAVLYGLKVKFHPIASVGEALRELEAGKYDVVISDFPITSTHREKFRFTEPVYLDRQVLISRDTTITSLLDLGGKEVWVVAGSPAQERLVNLSREIGDTIMIRTDSIMSAEQLFLLTAAGKIPRAVINQAKASMLASKNPAVKISNDISFTQFQSWIVDKNKAAIADTLDGFIRRFKETPQYSALLDRYMQYSASE